MRRMFAISLGILSALVLATAVSNAQAPAGQAPGGGRGQAPPPPTNLQILPKDIPRDQLIATMRGFTADLGVQCNYCHVQEGRGGRNDMAADEKAPKKTARVMMTLTKTVNDTLSTGIGKTAADVVKVECGTCHRGAAIPKYEAPPPAAPAAPGAGAARPPA